MSTPSVADAKVTMQDFEAAAQNSISSYFRFDIEFAKKHLGGKAETKEELAERYMFLKTTVQPTNKTPADLANWKKTTKRSYSIYDHGETTMFSDEFLLRHRKRNKPKDKPPPKTTTERQRRTAPPYRLMVKKEDILPQLFAAHGKMHQGITVMETNLRKVHWNGKRYPH